MLIIISNSYFSFSRITLQNFIFRLLVKWEIHWLSRFSYFRGLATLDVGQVYINDPIPKNTNNKLNASQPSQRSSTGAERGKFTFGWYYTSCNSLNPDWIGLLGMEQWIVVDNDRPKLNANYWCQNHVTSYTLEKCCDMLGRKVDGCIKRK